MIVRVAALIMAGGRGERFWPKSTSRLPKQFLSLADDGETMIQKTVKRLESLVAPEDTFVVTNASFKHLVQEQLPEIPSENILCEPTGRNTAPCIGLGAVHMRSRYGDAVMVVLPSDAMIHPAECFRVSLKHAINIAEQDGAMVTLGITPTSPNTGYGYIQYDRQHSLDSNGACRVLRFVEKPDLSTAQRYLSSGDYLWNSGMFVWRVSTILEQLKCFIPENSVRLERIASAIGKDNEQAVLADEYEHMVNISIDYGVMEKAERITVLPTTFAWDDVGSWLAIERMQPKDESHNVLQGDVVSIGCHHCIIQNSGGLVAAVGMENTVIVNTGNITLVCEKNSVGDIPKVLQELRKAERLDVL